MAAVPSVVVSGVSPVEDSALMSLPPSVCPWYVASKLAVTNKAGQVVMCTKGDKCRHAHTPLRTSRPDAEAAARRLIKSKDLLAKTLTAIVSSSDLA